MRTIDGNLTKELLDKMPSSESVGTYSFKINTYKSLVAQIAKLAYLNKDYLLFFRGQPIDHKNKAGSSTLYPSIYRGDYLTQREINYRFELLNSAGNELATIFKNEGIEGAKELRRKKYIQWSILQHYEICDTPLLDLTHSLRVACSFALLENNNNNGYIYVFGLPFITNRITINSEHDLVNIRLLSICPPEALRPYFQEGYLAGTTDITNIYDSKPELDFRNRLIAKFEIPTNVNFWGSEFKIMPKNALYPSKDKVLKLCKNIKIKVKKQLHSGQLGEFLKEWSEIEKLLTEATQKAKTRPTIRSAIQYLRETGKINEGVAFSIDKLRRYRNDIVHNPNVVESETLLDFNNMLSMVKQGLIEALR